MCVDDPYDYDDAYTQSQTNQSDNDDRQVTNFTVIDQGINFLENYPYYSCYLLVLCRLLDAIVKLEDESIAICTPDLLGKLFTVISQIFEIKLNQKINISILP